MDIQSTYFNCNSGSNESYEMTSESRLAVDVRNVVFEYKKKAKVLDKINVGIPEGKIYALLGSNGSGKTTLLRLVLGRLKPQSGSIRVFGVEPGSKQSNIPGSGVGYMPQDIALFNELTIEETLTYFGIIYHMKSDDIQYRIKHLAELLNFPEIKRKICELSGGQQRLVSIAVTMIHRPKLLILDEPTVGVDSLLRCRIWQYLEDICEKNCITVIITTHYIEETKTASTVGFINSGILLTQSNPRELLVKHNCKTLEEVFLKLCQQRIQEQKESRKSGKIKVIEEIWKPEETKKIDYVKDSSHTQVFEQKIVDFDHMKALLWKCFLRVKRNPLALLLFFSIPVLQIIFFTLCIGNKLTDLPIAIHNGDTDPELSNLFIDKIDQKIIDYSIYDTKQSAIDSVIKGKNWIAISFAENFSECFRTRFLDPNALADEEIEMSEINLYADLSNFAIEVTLNRSLLESLRDFMQNFSTTLGYDPLAFSLPINYEQPIYGTTEFAFNEYLSPAITISTLHALPMIFAAFLIILEKKSGHMERVYVSGVKPVEVLFSQMIQLFIAILSQVLLSMFVLFVIFDTPSKGSVLDVFVLFLLQGIQGMSFGILSAIIFTTEVSAAVVIFALILPLWLTSGVIWPLEAIPNILRTPLNWTPLTQPTETIRSIMLRGWSISNPKVQLGFAISLAYTVIVSVINIFLINIY